jgi:hypothetical protein
VNRNLFTVLGVPKTAFCMLRYPRISKHSCSGRGREAGLCPVLWNGTCVLSSSVQEDPDLYSMQADSDNHSRNIRYSPARQEGLWQPETVFMLCSIFCISCRCRRDRGHCGRSSEPAPIGVSFVRAPIRRYDARSIGSHLERKNDSIDALQIELVGMERVAHPRKHFCCLGCRGL